MKRPVTVLLLAAGSPGNYAIIKGLKQSTKYDVTLHAADCDPLKGNLFLPEIDGAYVVPPYDAPNYWDAVFDLVEILSAEVLISDLDEELSGLSAKADDLRNFGCFVVLPPPKALKICLDKMETYWKLKTKSSQPNTVDHMHTAEGVLWAAQSGKCVIKARYLRGGRGVDFVSGQEALCIYRKKHAERGPFIVQEYIPGNEYNVSTLHDLSGRLIYAATRIKLENRLNKANTIAAQIVEKPNVRDAALKAIERLGLDRGFNNVEIIERDGVPYVIDVNGGRWAGQDANLLASGINQAELYLDLALGEPVEPIEVPVGAISLKIKKDVVIGKKELDSLVWMRENTQ